MKRSEEWPNYRLKNDGTLIYLKSRYKNDNRVKSFVIVLKDPSDNSTRVSMELEDFKKFFTIDTDEPDDSEIKVEKNENVIIEKWRNVNDWVEVSSEGRIRIEGIIRNPVKNGNGHPFYLCKRNTDDGVETYMVTMWKELIKFKYPDYKATKIIFLDGNKTNLNLSNLEDARSTKHMKKLMDNDIESNALESEIYIRIKRHEFDAMKMFNHHVNEKYQNTIKELKKENEKLRKTIEANRLESNL